MSVQVYSNFDTLPERVTGFVENTARSDFFCGIAWFRTVLKTAVLAGDMPRLYVAEQGDRPVAALFASEREKAGRLKAHMLLGAGQGLYSATYRPLLDPEHGPAGLLEITAALAHASPAFDVLRFSGLDPGAPDYAALLGAFRASRMIVQRFANFQNWSEDVHNVAFEQYLAQRPAHIRAIAERGCLGLPEVNGPRFELVSDAAGLAAPLIDYALVDLQSAAPPEVHPDCIPELARAAAKVGVLRLGFLYIDDQPAAAQIWIVSGGKATQWRQRYAQRFTGLPIQVALTLAMLRQFFESDRIDIIEFSRDSVGTAPDWLADCEERGGIIVVNPLTAKGLLAAGRHFGGHWAMEAMRRARAVARRAAGG
jgi:hypothetical protein